jgi:crotonobetainyl-CoA:carnitine CoA-transferase CaiB-like acyl-CoA transferase
MNDPHLHARGMLNRMEHPYMGDVVLPSSPLRLFDYERLPVEFFPEIGANNQDVLADVLGLSESDVQALAADGII